MDKFLKDHAKLTLYEGIRHSVSVDDLTGCLIMRPDSCAVAKRWFSDKPVFKGGINDYHYFSSYIVLDYSSDFLHSPKFIMYNLNNSTSWKILTLDQIKKIGTTWYIKDKPRLCGQELTYLTIFNYLGIKPDRTTFGSIMDVFFIKVPCSDDTEQIRCCYIASKHSWAKELAEKYPFSIARRFYKEEALDTVPGPKFKKDTLFKWMKYNKGYSITGKEVCSFKNYNWVEKSINRKWKELQLTTNFLRRK